MTFILRSIVLLFVLTASTRALAQAEPDLRLQPSTGPNPWTKLDLNNDPRNFQFAIVTDRTGGHRPGVFEDAVRKLNLLQPEFVMSVGDLIEGYTRDESQIDRMWDEFQSFVANLKMPFFYVPGNHDLSNEIQHRKWAERFGKKYYHFVYRDVLFLCLNSEDPVRNMSAEQAEYARKALAENPNVRWTLAFLHQPLWVYEDRAAETAHDEPPTGWLEMEKVLAAGGRQYTVFAGHLHNYAKHMRNDRRYIVLASTGGASQLRGVQFGEFDHVAWITMTDDGPIVANLLLEGIWDEDVTTPASRRRVASLMSAARVITRPVRADSTTFAATTAQIKLVNDANVPLTVSGRFRDSDQLRPDPYAIDAVLEPNSVKLVDVKLDPRAADLKVADVEPVLLDLTMSYDMPTGPKLKIQRLLSIGVDRPLPLARREGAVAVDGKLDEWKDLPFHCRRPAQVSGDMASWTNADDASFRFGAAHDDENVYVAVDVTDERIIPRRGARPANGDGVEIHFDARPAAVRAKGRAEASQAVVINANPATEGDRPLVHELKQLPPGTRVAIVPTARGYAAEVAIPIAYVQKMAGSQDWKDVRINLSINDRDEIGGKAAQLWWRAGWETEQASPGSGTFERQ